MSVQKHWNYWFSCVIRKSFTYTIFYHIFHIVVQPEKNEFTLYMWLEHCLTSSEQVFSYIQDKIKLNITKKTIEIREGWSG